MALSQVGGKPLCLPRQHVQGLANLFLRALPQRAPQLPPGGAGNPPGPLHHAQRGPYTSCSCSVDQIIPGRVDKARSIIFLGVARTPAAQPLGRRRRSGYASSFRLIAGSGKAGPPPSLRPFWPSHPKQTPRPRHARPRPLTRALHDRPAHTPDPALSPRKTPPALRHVAPTQTDSHSTAERLRSPLPRIRSRGRTCPSRSAHDRCA